MECLLPYLCMVTVPHIMFGLVRMLDYRGVGLERFHCTCVCCEMNGEQRLDSISPEHVGIKLDTRTTGNAPDTAMRRG